MLPCSGYTKDSGPMLMGAVYVLGKLILLPYKAVARHKLARPGVEIMKNKDLAVLSLKFANPAYADLFREIIGLS